MDISQQIYSQFERKIDEWNSALAGSIKPTTKEIIRQQFAGFGEYVK